MIHVKLFNLSLKLKVDDRFRTVFYHTMPHCSTIKHLMSIMHHEFKITFISTFALLLLLGTTIVTCTIYLHRTSINIFKLLINDKWKKIHKNLYSGRMQFCCKKPVILQRKFCITWRKTRFTQNDVCYMERKCWPKGFLFPLPETLSCLFIILPCILSATY